MISLPKPYLPPQALKIEQTPPLKKASILIFWISILLKSLSWNNTPPSFLIKRLHYAVKDDKTKTWFSFLSIRVITGVVSHLPLIRSMYYVKRNFPGKAGLCESAQSSAWPPDFRGKKISPVGVGERNSVIWKLLSLRRSRFWIWSFVGLSKPNTIVGQRRWYGHLPLFTVQGSIWSRISRCTLSSLFLASGACVFFGYDLLIYVNLECVNLISHSLKSCLPPLNPLNWFFHLFCFVCFPCVNPCPLSNPMDKGTITIKEVLCTSPDASGLSAGTKSMTQEPTTKTNTEVNPPSVDPTVSENTKEDENLSSPNPHFIDMKLFISKLARIRTIILKLKETSLPPATYNPYVCAKTTNLEPSATKPTEVTPLLVAKANFEPKSEAASFNV